MYPTLSSVVSLTVPSTTIKVGGSKCKGSAGTNLGCSFHRQYLWLGHAFEQMLLAVFVGGKPVRDHIFVTRIAGPARFPPHRGGGMSAGKSDGGLFPQKSGYTLFTF